jgi:hypothetical protein
MSRSPSARSHAPQVFRRAAPAVDPDGYLVEIEQNA